MGLFFPNDAETEKVNPVVTENADSEHGEKSMFIAPFEIFERQISDRGMKMKGVFDSSPLHV